MEYLTDEQLVAIAEVGCEFDAGDVKVHEHLPLALGGDLRCAVTLLLEDRQLHVDAREDAANERDHLRALLVELGTLVDTVKPHGAVWIRTKVAA